MQNLIENLNALEKEERLAALRGLKSLIDSGEIAKPATGRDVNNHIHTTYSFSPYSPAKAAWTAYMSGLCTTGIVDHDSVSGVREFIEAGEILDFPITCGFELRVTHSTTTLGSRRTNNPDQSGISYLTFHGLPHTQIEAVVEFLKPVGISRGERNRKMCKKIAEILQISLDYDAGVLPISMAGEGGSVTERHLLCAAAMKLEKKFGRGGALVDFLKNIIPVSEKMVLQLSDAENPHFIYDLIGLLKAQLVEKFYIPANRDECPDMLEAVKFANSHGIIATYPYLGDVGESVTGDKKAQTFEDSFLDKLFEILHSAGIRAISYMPSRNTREQLLHVRSLCDKWGMFQISGEDINTSRQSFICMAQRDPMFENLFDTTWALISHEKKATENLENSFPFLDMPLDKKMAFFLTK